MDNQSYLEIKLESKILSQGCSSYAKGQYAKVKNNILFYIQLYPNKRDAYIWYAVYPLIIQDIDLGSGILAKRFPEEESFLINNSESLESFTDYVSKQLNQIFEYFDGLDSLNKISCISAENVMQKYIQAFCFADLHDLEQSLSYSQEFIDSGLTFTENYQHIVKLTESISSKKHKNYLENNIQKNIKKLKLTAFIK